MTFCAPRQNDLQAVVTQRVKACPMNVASSDCSHSRGAAGVEELVEGEQMRIICG